MKFKELMSKLQNAVSIDGVAVVSNDEGMMVASHGEIYFYPYGDGESRWLKFENFLISNPSNHVSICSNCGVELKCEEDEVDWSQVSVDTKIFVKNFKDISWKPRYFARYENGAVYVWDNGATSFSTDGLCTFYEYAKLAEE